MSRYTFFELRDLNFYKNYLGDNFEYCGNFRLLGDIYLVVDEMSIVTGTKLGRQAGRLVESSSCEHDHYSQFIFHTHPNTSKFYPSTADLQKILKHVSINYSIIFTKFGVWVLRLSAADTFEKEYIESYPVVDKLQHIGDIFYRQTEHGRSYNPKAVNEYISRLQTAFHPLKIRFYTWELLDRKGVLRFN